MKSILQTKESIIKENKKVPPKIATIVDEVTEIETGVSRGRRLSTLPSFFNHSINPNRKYQKSVAFSSTSIGSFLTRQHQTTSHAQPTTEGRIRLRHTVDCGSDILCCKWANDGTMLGVALFSGEVRMFTPTGQPSLTIPAPECKTDSQDFERDSSLPEGLKPQNLFRDLLSKHLPIPAATSLVWHPDDNNTVIVSYSDGQVLIWELPPGGFSPKKPKVSAEGLGIDIKLAAAPGNKDNIIVYTKWKVTLRNIKTFKTVTEFESHRPSGCLLKNGGAIWTVAVKGRDVIAGGHSLIWWDTRSGELKRQIEVHIRGASLSFHPTTTRIVTGSYGGANESVKVWDTALGKITHTLFAEGYQTNVKSTVWAGRDLVAVGGADPHVIRLVNLDNTTLGGIKGLKNGVTFMDSYIGRGHQSSKLAAAAGTFLYMIDLPK